MLLHQYAAAQTVVLGVMALADVALAAYYWHAARGACAQECDSQCHRYAILAQSYTFLLKHRNK